MVAADSTPAAALAAAKATGAALVFVDTPPAIKPRVRLTGEAAIALDQMFAGDRGDPSHSMQAIEGCTGWSCAEPHS
jgi:hypothetical protein